MCLVLVVLPALFCGLADIDSWPYSSYPMYSGPVRLGGFRQYNAFIVRQDGESVELRNREALWPLNYQRLQVRARVLLALPDGRQRLVDLLNYYSRRAIEHFHKKGKPGGFPEKLQLRLCEGSYAVQEGRLRNLVEEEEVVVEVVNRP